jgi:Lantibiotic dehydratase, N terminus
VLVDRHPDADRLRAAAAADIGPQFRPLYPTWWPGYTARIAPTLGVTDHQLAFTDAPGADPLRVLPITALTVLRRDGELFATTADGRNWPLNDVFALLVGWLGSEVFKLAGTDPHLPRITVDRLVVTRETWRTTVAGTGLRQVAEGLPQYLAARRLRRELGLPDRVFAKLDSQVKPVYVDFTSPRHVSAFSNMVRGAEPQVRVVFTELLPTPELAWLPDAEGRGYYSELRLHLRDPARPEGGE